MKNIIFTLLTLLSLNSYGQVIADPALSQMRVSNLLDDITINANNIPSETIVRLKVPVFNRNLLHSLPPGTCKIKIGLGSKLVLDPNFNLATVNTSNYFTWTAEFYSGQIQITGDLIAQLPENFSDTATFNLKGSILGSSTITTNFLVTNHNTTTILSDEDPTNNTSFLAYTIVQGPIPVTFTKITAAKNDCNITVNFDAEREINVSRYDIEISKDGIDYHKIGQLVANNLIHYQYKFLLTENIQSPVIYVRVRSVDFDGRLQYSETRTVGGTCNKAWGVNLYPNPVAHGIKYIIINANEGVFNGSYIISLLDMSGKLLNTKELLLANTKQFNYGILNLASGQYILKILNIDGTQSAIIKFQKL